MKDEDVESSNNYLEIIEGISTFESFQLYVAKDTGVENRLDALVGLNLARNRFIH